METGGLKSFAGEARRQLLSEVRARLDLVLAEGSTQRREFADVVRKLELAVGDAGGGEAGRVAVVDRVAYTWFNRIVALRFMDANGFNDVGVVSPAVDRPDGQPEVLVDAKRGVIDADVVAPADAQRVAGLLNGSVTSADPESEAFGLLLAAYCRFWNKSMPFMFEHSADYTELLMPADLLSDESVIARAVTVLTTDVCTDVEVIGWLYQFYISERKDEVFAGFKKGKKAGAAEIPAATQLFTPDWIVRYLVENSLGRLWMLNRPDSTLVDRMDYYIAPIDEETDFLRIESPEEIKVMDPACGSGHMLTYAFDLLFAMYEEDGYNPVDIPALILSKNLYGTEIDPRAGALAAFALTMKARARQRTFFTRNVTPNICVLEPVTFRSDELDQLVSSDGDRDAEESFFTMFTDADTLGALIRPDESLLPELRARVESLVDGGTLFDQDLAGRARQVVTQAGYLASRYQVVVANPPYMGTRNMTEAMRQFAEEVYSEYSDDLCTMFIDISLSLTAIRGFAALVVSESWLFNSSFEEMRRDVVRRATPTTTACIDKAAFGVRLNTAATVFERGAIRDRSKFFRVTSTQLTSGAIAALPCVDSVAYDVDVQDFDGVPGGAFIFDMPPSLLALYGQVETVGELFDVKQGLATADNGQFVRMWWEVSSTQLAFGCTDRTAASQTGKRWFPYNKGGTPTPWWGNQDHVVNWKDDGLAIRAFGTENGGRPRSRAQNTDYYFRSSVTWSNIGSGGARFRFLPPGFIFDIAGMSAFAGTTDEQLALLGYLNSRVVRVGLDVLAPTLNYQVGDVARLPFVSGDGDVERVEQLVELARTSWAENETAHEFLEHPFVGYRRSTLFEARTSANRVRRERDVQLALLERLSDEYWSNRISEASGRAIPVEVEHEPRKMESASEADDVQALVSYAVGCMFGRYSLDEPGLILANQGDTLPEYLARIPDPSFMPDEDNVIPVLADDWFDDDIVERFRLFLRVAFSEEHFEENLRFVEESLGKDIRKYFLTDFYKDHVQRYKKRPIYWMFSSPKGTFNALIYMHRYTPSTVSTVLNEYLREFQAKLDAELANQARIAGDPSASARDKARAEKESDKIRKMIAELRDYEHEVLYPLASRQISIDLDDGVKANYPKFGTALKKIPGLEATND